MNKISVFSNPGPVLVLFILSPVIAELLFGSTPVSRSYQLIMESLYYGSGAVLIREFARRHNMGWLSIITLGIGFGILEECLTLQSAFNPDFLGNNVSYGRSFGVNWVWGMCIVGYHSIWSISIPILFTELLFPKLHDLPWLGRTGSGILLVLFILTSVAFYTFFYRISGFRTSFIHVLISAILAAGLAISSLWLPVSPRHHGYFKRSPSFLAGVISFLASACWFGLLFLVFRPNSGVKPWLAELAGVLLIVVVVFLFLSWSEENWNINHRFFLACGCLYASMLFGLNTLSHSHVRSDFYFQISLIIVVTLLLIGFKRRFLLKNIENQSA